MPLLNPLKPDTLKFGTLCVFTSGASYGKDDGYTWASLYLGKICDPAEWWEDFEGYVLDCYYEVQIELSTGFVYDKGFRDVANSKPLGDHPYYIGVRAFGGRVVGDVDLTDRYSMSKYLRMCVPQMLDHLRALPEPEETVNIET